MFVTDVDYEALTAEAVNWVEPERQMIPDGLDTWVPGPRLGVVLSSIDRSRLSGYDLVVVMRARNRQLAHDHAQLMADMVEVSHCADAELGRSEEAWDYASDEIRAALTLTRRAAESELGFATDIFERFPQVFEALLTGQIDVRKSKTIIHNIGHLDSDTATTVVDQILTEASELTTGQLRARIQKLCFEADSEEAKRRYEERLAERRIEPRYTPDGTAHLLGLDLAPHKVAAVRGDIEVTARQLKAAGDPRTMDQIRADIYIERLLGKRASKTHSQSKNRKKRAGGGTITMHAGLETLAGLAEQTADLPGLGPVISDIARQVLENHPDAEYRYKITAENGDVIIGTPSRKATRALRRFLETRDETCVEPGCRMPAEECDIDHRKRWVDGGLTNDENNQPLCRHGHMVKDDGGWQLFRNPNGTYTWISRLGHTYTTGRSP